MHLKFSLLTCGCCKHPEWSAIRTSSFSLKEFPAHLGLIEHPKHGLILFDTGYAPRIQQATDDWTLRVYNRILAPIIPTDEDLPSQLLKRGYKTEDVKYIIISHFHPDHIAGLKDFPSANFICAREAWGKLHKLKGWKAFRHCHISSLLPADMETRLRFIEDAPRCALHEKLPGFHDGYDLFGDSTLIGIPLPGHAIGQYGLYLQNNGKNDIFLIADSCWRSKSYRNFILPPSIVMALLHDPAEYKQTLLKLHRLSLTRSDIRLIPSHCNEITRELEGSQ